MFRDSKEEREDSCGSEFSLLADRREESPGVKVQSQDNNTPHYMFRCCDFLKIQIRPVVTF